MDSRCLCIWCSTLVPLASIVMGAAMVASEKLLLSEVSVDETAQSFLVGAPTSTA